MHKLVSERNPGVGVIRKTKKGKNKEEPKMFGAPVMNLGGRAGTKFKPIFG